MWQIVTQLPYDGYMQPLVTTVDATSCPSCGNDTARVRFDDRGERIAITCTSCRRTDLRALMFSPETHRAADILGVELRFVEPS